MPHYIQFDQRGLPSLVYYSTPPVGFHSALASMRLAEYEAQIDRPSLSPDERSQLRAQFAASSQTLRDERDTLLRQEAEFMSKLAAEGLELYKVPETEIKDGVAQIEYEDIEPGKPERGKRISRAFEVRAKTWRKLSQIVLP